MGALTILDIALAKGAAQDAQGRISGGEFDRLGLLMMSGCQRCGATLGPYGAYPSRTGLIQCGECIADDMSFATVAEFDAFEASTGADG